MLEVQLIYFSDAELRSAAMQPRSDSHCMLTKLREGLRWAFANVRPQVYHTQTSTVYKQWEGSKVCLSKLSSRYLSSQTHK